MGRQLNFVFDGIADTREHTREFASIPAKFMKCSELEVRRLVIVIDIGYRPSEILLTVYGAIGSVQERLSRFPRPILLRPTELLVFYDQWKSVSHISRANYSLFRH